jgi:alanine-glyoxylate transaminase/serine-glyoxylate transaminase/serine-pyruvate transaminase
MLIGTLAGVEMGLRDSGVPHRAGGVQAAMDLLGQKFESARAAA